MDPLNDEKLISIVSSSCREYYTSRLHVAAEREAYGPSKNEGLCYESCQAVGFSGELNGTLYFGMDGYTRLKLLPRIAKHYQSTAASNDPGTLLLQFAHDLVSEIISEFQENGFHVDLGEPTGLNNRIVTFDLSRQRQYILIFFIRDRRLHEYLGRIYIVLLVQKY